MSVTSEASSRYSGVQVLRFVAALLVVVTHATLYTHERLDPSLELWLFGGVGVDIFFVISGFVMVMSSRAIVGRDDAWKYFAVRRLIRIVPIYWIATTVKLLTMLAASGLVLHADLGWNVPLSYLFLPSTNVDGYVQPLLGVGWTLTFEMFFYTLFAVALLLRVDPIKFCGVLLAAIAAVSVFRTDEWPAATTYFHPRVLYFLAGMLIAKYALDRVRGLAMVALGCIAALFVALHVSNALLNGQAIQWWDHVLRPVSVIVLVLVVVSAEPLIAGRLPRVMTYQGDASYSLYLFHPIIAPAVPVALSIVGFESSFLSIGLTVSVAVVAAALIFRFIEGPITKRLQARLPYVWPPRDRPRAHPEGGSARPEIVKGL